MLEKLFKKLNPEKRVEVAKAMGYRVEKVRYNSLKCRIGDYYYLPKKKQWRYSITAPLGKYWYCYCIISEKKLHL